MRDIFDKSVLLSLRDLEKETGEGLVDEMIHEFVGDISSEIEKMKIFLNTGEFEKLSRIAHSLKSSSANIGAIGLSNFLAQIEEMIVRDKDNDAEKLGVLIDEIESILPPTIDNLKAS